MLTTDNLIDTIDRIQAIGRNHSEVVYQEAVTTLERLERSGDHVMVSVDADGVGPVQLFDSPVEAHDALSALRAVNDTLCRYGNALKHVAIHRDETALGLTH